MVYSAKSFEHLSALDVICGACESNRLHQSVVAGGED